MGREFSQAIAQSRYGASNSDRQSFARRAGRGSGEDLGCLSAARSRHADLNAVQAARDCACANGGEVRRRLAPRWHARMTEQRRLAAILVADVVGYSRLIGSDESGTLAQLEALRTETIEPQIAKHAGRLFKSVGDGFLIEFASAVQAVSCAQAIQDANGQGRLPLRIGIHVGDVVVQGDDLMGDGVNVAARVEGVAEPGGIAITRAVHEQVRDKLDLGFMDKGEIELKNIQRPVQVFVIEGTKTDSQATALALPDKPSIAVLAFQNMSGDPEQEYFAEGVS